MFSNIGRKIKGLAKFLFWATVAIAIFLGIGTIIFRVGNIYADSSERISAVIMGVVIILGGIILAWLQNFLLYGYGELIDSNQKILKILEEKNKEENNE